MLVILNLLFALGHLSGCEDGPRKLTACSTVSFPFLYSLDDSEELLIRLLLLWKQDVPKNTYECPGSKFREELGIIGYRIIVLRLCPMRA